MPLTNNATIEQTPKLTHTKFIVLTAMFTALTYICTYLGIELPIGFSDGAFVHFGNIPFFIAAILFGRKVGAISGGVGMALFDVLSKYTAWAPYTLVIGLLTGYFIGLITERNKSKKTCILAFVVAAIIKVVGYYIAEAIIYGNWYTPVFSITANVLQVVIAGIAVIFLVEPLYNAAKNSILKSGAR